MQKMQATDQFYRKIRLEGFGLQIYAQEQGTLIRHYSIPVRYLLNVLREHLQGQFVIVYSCDIRRAPQP